VSEANWRQAKELAERVPDFLAIGKRRGASFSVAPTN
jgi:hypothetical protein